jgi:hypothetical protein
MQRLNFEGDLHDKNSDVILAEMAYLIGDAFFLARRLDAGNLALILNAALVELASIDENNATNQATALAAKSARPHQARGL